MLNSLHIRFTNGKDVTWFYPMFSIVQSMRVRYPEATIIRLKDDLYMLTLNHESHLDTPRAICDMLLERDEQIASYEWMTSEVPHDS